MATTKHESSSGHSNGITNGINGHNTRYDMLKETEDALQKLYQALESQLPPEFRKHIFDSTFSTANTAAPYFPTPLKQTETISALKAVEAGAAGCIADLRFGQKNRKKHVDLERASCFLFSAYTATVGGREKQDPEVKKLLKPTDLFQAQSILYRRLSANLYRTKDDRYFHIHGSLEASATLNMIGLESHRPDMTDYRQCLDLIESHVMRHTADELETMNAKIKNAGVTCLTWDEWCKTSHGQIINAEPPFRLTSIEETSPPAPFPSSGSSSSTSRPQILSGIRVLELCRVIAGPSMGRGLAEYGADVLKVTSASLPDVPFFQVDGNLGKHTTDLDLRSPSDRAVFEKLLLEADVILDGYRAGALARLGYGPEQIVALTASRGRGIVYVAENCFGHVGPWATRPGWQQIADCATGVAWAQGNSMGLNEPVVPPFPMSDYGTGCIGTIAAMTGLYARATRGGSWLGTTSLAQYNVLLLRMGLYDSALLSKIRDMHDADFYGLRHEDSVDEVGRRALLTIRRVHPELFDSKHYHEADSRGFGAPVRFAKPVVQLEGTWNGFVRNSRPNGFDRPEWEGWETQEDMLAM